MANDKAIKKFMMEAFIERTKRDNRALENDLEELLQYMMEED